MSPDKKDPPEAKSTVKEWADFANKTNPKVKCPFQWNGDELSFCHWKQTVSKTFLIGLKN